MLFLVTIKNHFGFGVKRIVNVSKDLVNISTRIFFLFFSFFFLVELNFLFSSSWSPGEWERGIPRSLQWKQAELLPKYSWGEALSLVEMESWVRSAVETFFSYNFKSQLVCEGNYLTSSLSTLVCDCVDGRSGSFFFSFNFFLGNQNPHPSFPL